jgi:hypothetical protein
MKKSDHLKRPHVALREGDGVLDTVAQLGVDLINQFRP